MRTVCNKLPLLFICLFFSFSSSALSDDSQRGTQSIHLIFRVLGWKPKDAIGIKYPRRVSKDQMKADMDALAQAHGWKYFENSLDITSEDGKTIAWRGGPLSEKQFLAAFFTLNFQAVHEQFYDYESIIVDIIGKNGFAYQGTFTLDALNWQERFEFSKSWAGMSSYQIRYILHSAQIPETVILPTLKASASVSASWLLKVIPLLILLMLLPGATVYLFLQRGVSLNERGKVKLSPSQAIFTNIQLFLITFVTVYLGCADVCAALTRNSFLGFIFGGATVPTLSFVIFAFILHRYEKAIRGTTWTFRENLSTSFRAMVLGLPAILLPLCFVGTMKLFPQMSMWGLGAVVLIEYAVLTFLFACLIPFLIRWIWKGEALQDDEIRQRLERLAQRAGVAYRDVILLHTKRSKLANAWVAGVLPKFRFLFVSDYLAEHLTLQELETIFAHELGHLKHRHLFKQVGWIILGFAGQLISLRLGYLLLSLLPIPSWLYWLLFLIINLGLIFLGVQLGLMKFWRRMEFEADAYAVELTQQPAVFREALRKLIQLNDAPENLAKFDEMLATHPNFQARVVAIEKLVVRDM